jgi:hypothetical protein
MQPFLYLNTPALLLAMNIAFAVYCIVSIVLAAGSVCVGYACRDHLIMGTMCFFCALLAVTRPARNPCMDSEAGYLLMIVVSAFWANYIHFGQNKRTLFMCGEHVEDVIACWASQPGFPVRCWANNLYDNAAVMACTIDSDEALNNGALAMAGLAVAGCVSTFLFRAFYSEPEPAPIKEE